MGYFDIMVDTGKYNNKLQSLGVSKTFKSEEEVKHWLLKTLKKDIHDISDIYSTNQLINFYEAVNGDFPVNHQEKKEKPKKPTPIKSRSKKKKRARRRVDLTDDVSYVTAILEKLAPYPDLLVVEIKTGLAIKYKRGGYRSNVLNYNQVRTIHGRVYGDLYFNLIKSEDQFEELGILHDYKWFRSYAMIPKIPIDEVIRILTPNNIQYLISLNEKSHKRKKTNTNRLIDKLN